MEDSKPPIHKREPIAVYHGSAAAFTVAQLELLHLPTWLHTIVVIVAFLISGIASRNNVTPTATIATSE